MAFFRTTWVSRHQKGKPFWILIEQEMMGWQWHQLDYVQIICTSLQTDNHVITSSISFLCPTQHKIGHFGDVLPWLGMETTKPNTTKAHIHQSKMYYNTK